MYSMWINSIIDMIFTGNLCILFFIFSGMCSNIIIYVLYALLVLKHFNFNLFNLYLTRRDSEIKNLFYRSVLAKMDSNTSVSSQDITTQTD